MMKFLSRVMLSPSSKFIFPIYIVFLIYYTRQTTAQVPKIPALFAFGDSILDTGNNDYLRTASKCNYIPYGIDFSQHAPTGRFGNGKVFSDQLAEGLGIKSLLPAYLNPKLQSNELSTGVCFASGGSGLDELTAKVQNVSSSTSQFNNFKEYVGKLEGVVGAEKAKDIISNALFLFSAGNNDIAINYYGLHLRPEYNIDKYTTMLVDWASSLIKDIYGLGARRFAFMSTLPLGCLPGVRTTSGGPLRLCAPIISQAAKLFNSKMETNINNLNTTLQGAKLVFIDVYNPLLQIIQRPLKSGFMNAINPCCSSALLEGGFLCTALTSLVCPDTSRYVFWDSAHPSEKTYSILVSQIIEKYKDKF